MNRRTPFLALLVFACLMFGAPARAESTATDVQTAWRLLDYVAVDYAGAVRDGRVSKPSEYAEMTEFSRSVRERIAALPPSAARAALVAQAGRIESRIAAKASPEAVAASARALGKSLIAAYPVPLAPKTVPDMARGAQLYARNCASCHGLTGDGKGPMAAGLDPKPIAFADRGRARERSIFGLYQVISQGLDGTAMQSFGDLPDADRWALAFHAGQFAYPKSAAVAGARVWTRDANVRKLVPDMTSLVGVNPASLAKQIGEAKAGAVTAYLRAEPGAVTARGAQSLSVARDKLGQSLAAYETGNVDAAKDLALAAYLDGFEPVEPALGARDPALLADVERAMGELRAAIGQHRPIDDVRRRVQTLDGLFTQSEATLGSEEASTASTLIGAAAILLREGLEALIIVVAMLAFLRKADRTSVVRYVHGGWIVALIAGVATWWAATRIISASGASRELTEGFGSLLAAVVLLLVGVWMHGKAQADEWQRYIREKLDKALSRRSAWFLFTLAFVAVYREVFETILFYAAITTNTNGGAVFAGAAAGIGVLALVAWAMFRFSRKLPITKFFAYTSGLIAVLAVVLAGKGVAALQEAGLMGVMPLAWMPRIPVLGIFPTAEALTAQLGMIAALALGIAYNGRRRNRAQLTPISAVAD